jgi:hypothetical protein
MIQTIGPHRIQTGSIMNGLSELMGGQKADVFYCDPPWGAGTLKAFETLNHKYGEKAGSVQLNDFLVTLFALAVTHTRGPIFIEYGLKWKESVIAAAVAQGLQSVATAVCSYKSGSRVLPHHLHVFAMPECEYPKLDLTAFQALSNPADLTEAVLKQVARPGQIVLDPCCGLGSTAIAAKRLGMVFYGNELTAKRLEATAKRLK